jgi:hypothetical protein
VTGFRDIQDGWVLSRQPSYFGLGQTEERILYLMVNFINKTTEEERILIKWRN